MPGTRQLSTPVPTGRFRLCHGARGGRAYEGPARGDPHAGGGLGGCRGGRRPVVHERGLRRLWFFCETRSFFDFVFSQLYIRFCP